MSAITRRAALTAFSAASTALVTSPAWPADDEWTRLRSFLEKASAAERMHYHLMQAADAANEVRPGIWRVECGLDVGFLVLINDARHETEAAV